MRAIFSYILQALLAALFFGASAPLSKRLLGDVPPVLMAAFLYLGSSTGLSLVKLSQRLTPDQKEAGIRPPVRCYLRTKSMPVSISICLLCTSIAIAMTNFPNMIQPM